MKTIRLSIFVENFFTDWLMNQRKASSNTICSYRDTFILLFRYAENHLKKKPNQLTLADINADFICDFLTDLVKRKKISPRTRNARLSALKSFCNYLSFKEPESTAFIGRILAIPESKISRRQVHFLTPQEVEALLKVQNLKTWGGRRDYAMIVLAIETGLRLTELISLKWNDVFIEGNGGYVQCIGKGRKARSTPLTTIKVLKHWKVEMEGSSSVFVFPSNRGTLMSRNCFQKKLERQTLLAAKYCGSLLKKKITPHMLRHTAAMNFLQAGIDLSTIAIILGHDSLETTQIYLEADMQLKEAALKKLTPKNIKIQRFKAEDNLVQRLKKYK